MKLATVALALAAACATVKTRENVCPEYRDLRCYTEPVCSLDRARGCEVCACAELKPLDAPGGPATGGPGTPDRPPGPPPAWTPQGASGK